MLGTVKDLVWPSGFLSKIGRITAALSVFGLIVHARSQGLGPTLSVILDFYDALLNSLLGWAHAPLQQALTWFALKFNVRLSLDPHWKYVFVLLGIYFFREAGVAWTDGRLGRAAFNVARSLIVAMATAVVAATVPMTSGEFGYNFFVGFVAILGTVVYGLIGFVWDAKFIRERDIMERDPTFLSHYTWGAKRVLGRATVGVLVLWAGVHMLAVRSVNGSGIVMLVFLAFTFALYWLCEGIPSTRKRRAVYPREAWWDAYRNTDFARLGLAMLGVFFWMGVLALIEAGEGLLGRIGPT